jgi:hypothetical protein
MITEDFLELVPAYGRDYKNALDAKRAFTGSPAGSHPHDWELASVGYNGKYCSVRDFKPGTKVNLRYRQLTRVAVVEVPA